MKIRLAAPLQSDSVVDGLGIRTVIWTQGCSHNCPFCHNAFTQDFDGGYLEEVDNVIDEIDELKGQDGITLSGGDPLFQIDAVLEIAKYAKKKNINIWCYTGFTWDEVINLSKKNKKYMEFLENIDVLVDGRFEIDKRDANCLFRGSSNQKLIDVPKTLKKGKIVVVPESDGIMEKFQSKEETFI